MSSVERKRVLYREPASEDSFPPAPLAAPSWQWPLAIFCLAAFLFLLALVVGGLAFMCSLRTI